MSKQAVQLSKKKRTKYRFQKIKMCKKCNRYSVLKDDCCPTCGSSFLPIESIAKSMFKNKVLTDAISLLIFVCLGIIFAPTLKTLYFSLFAGILFCIGYVVMNTIFIKSEYYFQLKKLIHLDILKMKQGIYEDSELAKKDIKEARAVHAYEKLREIGDFIINNEMKIRRIMVLNDLVLRKDMELELDTLVPTSYDKDFVKYTLDVMKVNRSLVTKKVISYFVLHRNQISADFGNEALISMAGNATRMKLYILEFSSFIEEYIEYFPKDRLIKLCRILTSNPTEGWESLYQKTRDLVKRKYDFDPDFHRFF
ncbi:hypothetical protein ACFSO7_23250 [Bacillus sp. CGMCC 1.16607]|uniref:hypothetical protein n=1 Tax=Bacillus sp. CGMCC 1.16607 TaxID=3351842 RepID=UPI003644E714